MTHSLVIGQNASEKVMIALFVRKEVNKKSITYNIRLTLIHDFSYYSFIKHFKVSFNITR